MPASTFDRSHGCRGRGDRGLIADAASATTASIITAALEIGRGLLEEIIFEVHRARRLCRRARVLQ